MPPSETGKQRAARIPLDYFRQPTVTGTWKNRLAALALILTVGAIGVSLVSSHQGKPFVSRGPVTAVHAAWDNSCEACHVDFAPMSRGNVATSYFGSPGSRDFAGNLLCEQCHSGVDHHVANVDKQKMDASTPGCGGCHRDHRGREASLVRLADSDCTQCHAGLNGYVKDPKGGFENAVTNFATNHPDFRSLTPPDPGKLKFNHRLHMLPGQVVETGQANPWTLGKIADEAQRKRYAASPWQKNKDDKDLVTLDCASCHRLDSGDYGIEAGEKLRTPYLDLKPRAAGAYMLPLNYEIHCSACHPLTFDKTVTGKTGQPLEVPHHLQPSDVKDFIWGAYAAAYKDKDLDARVKESLKAGPNPTRPLPGKLTREEQLARSSITDQALAAEKFLFKDKVSQADGYLLTGKTACGECHFYEEAGARVQPVKVNQVWLVHAKFNHVSHRAADCRVCHADAYPDGPNASKVATDVLIAGIESCRQCHSPAGGVRSDCTECHTYHNGDRPLQGFGAAARDPGGKDEPRRFPKIEQFLKGTQD